MPSPSVAFVYNLQGPVSTPGTAAPTTVTESGWKDLALDPATGDLRLTQDPDDETDTLGGIQVRLVSGSIAVAQRVNIRFRLWLTEYHLDTRVGIPYVQQVLVANPDLALIRSLFRRVIKSTPGIKSVGALVMRWLKPDRRLIVDEFRATLVDGSTLTVEQPFIVFEA